MSSPFKKTPHDQQVADIYEKMLYGDKSAINELGRIRKSQQIILQQSPPTNSKQNQYTHHNQEPQMLSDDHLVQRKKSQIFKNYLKEKVRQLRKQRITNQQTENENIFGQYQSIDQISKKTEFKQSKPFATKKRGTTKNITSQAVTEENTDKRYKPDQKNINANRGKSMNPISTKKTVSSNNERATKENFKKNLQKQVVKDQQDKGLTPPSSKNSFRVKTQIGKSHKLRQQLIRINQQQKIIQAQVVQLHNSSKNQIDKIKEKYSLNSKSHIGSRVFSEKMIDTPSTPLVNNNKINQEKSKIQSIYAQIEFLNQVLEQSKNTIKNKEDKCDISPILNYTYAQQDIFEARQSQEQADSVEDLPANHQEGAKLPGMNKTYQSLMKDQKKKKWGLVQRFEYDLSKPDPNDKKKKQYMPGIQPIVNSDLSQGNGQNKVVVNPRLKQLLFD